MTRSRWSSLVETDLTRANRRPDRLKTDLTRANRRPDRLETDLTRANRRPYRLETDLARANRRPHRLETDLTRANRRPDRRRIGSRYLYGNNLSVRAHHWFRGLVRRHWSVPCRSRWNLAPATYGDRPS